MCSDRILQRGEVVLVVRTQRCRVHVAEHSYLALGVELEVFDAQVHLVVVVYGAVSLWDVDLELLSHSVVEEDLEHLVMVELDVLGLVAVCPGVDELLEDAALDHV